jgi:hypothetical protein
MEAGRCSPLFLDLASRVRMNPSKKEARATTLSNKDFVFSRARAETFFIFLASNLHRLGLAPLHFFFLSFVFFSGLVSKQ